MTNVFSSVSSNMWPITVNLGWLRTLSKSSCEIVKEQFVVLTTAEHAKRRVEVEVTGSLVRVGVDGQFVLVEFDTQS